MHIRNAPILIALALSLASCSAQPEANGVAAGGRSGGRGGGAVPVVTARVEQKPMPVALAAVGGVESMSSVQIRAQVTGQVSAVRFTEGQDVQAGQPLFTLDARPFQAALKQAEAVLARDSVTLQNARAQQTRSSTLFQRGLLPRDQYENQGASVDALAATVEADKAAVDTAKLNLQYTEIKAPIDGRTGSLGAHVGDMVRASDTNALIMINQLSPVYVTFSVPGRYLADIRRYQAIKPLVVTAATAAGLSDPAATSNAKPAVAPAASPSVAASGVVPARMGQPAAGTRGYVSFIDNAVDPATASIRLKATFPNADRQLWPGTFVNVTLDLTTDSNALVVPAVAVQASQDGQYVYVVKPDRTVELRTVTVARQVGDQIVIASGVAAGDVVVTDGHLRLTPGALVSDRNESGAGRGPAKDRAGNAARGDGGGRSSR